MFRTKMLLICLAFLLVFIPYSVKADCDACSPDKCEECGCELKDGKCVYANFDPDGLKSCGNHTLTRIPSIIPKLTSIVYTIIQIAVPVLLVLFGSMDLIKGVIAAKEDEIKKGQQTLIQRLIIGALVFFVFVIVKFLVSVVADDNDRKTGVLGCAECFIEGKCD